MAAHDDERPDVHGVASRHRSFAGREASNPPILHNCEDGKVD